MSPGQASSTVSRSEAKNRMGLCTPMDLAGARLFQLHVAAEASGRQPQERHPVAVIGIHIGLDLEDKAGDFLVRRDAHRGRSRPGRGAMAHTPPARPAIPPRRNSSAPSRNRPARDGLRDRWPDRSAAGLRAPALTSSSSLAFRSPDRASPPAHCGRSGSSPLKAMNSSVCRS